MSPGTVDLFGLPFNSMTLAEAVESIVSDAAAGIRGYVFTANVDHIVQLQSNPAFQEAYRGARYIFADGAPVVLVSKASPEGPLPERVTGADLLPAVAAASARRGLRLYFLGGEAGVAERAAARLLEKHPGLVVCGTYSPPRGFEKSPGETKAIVARINESAADILFVGVGAPKQELWTADNFDALRVPIILCTGAAFDFEAENKRRAPRLLRRTGLEWAWRLFSEPRRMWRRYLVQDRAFLGLALREVRRLRKSRRAAPSPSERS